MRLFSSIIAGLATFAFAASASAALVIDVTSDVPTIDLNPGDQFTLTITLSTTTAGEAQGLTLRAAGWAPGDISFVDSTAPNEANSAGGAIFGAIAPLVIPAVGTFPSYQNFIANVNPGAVIDGDSIVLFNGVTTSSTTGAGPESFTLTLQANAGGGNIEIGAISSFGDAYVSTSGTTAPTTTIAHSVVPEPGTALLMGLGLAGLAAAGRRE